MILIAVFFLYQHYSKLESTDDAFIDAHVIPISPRVAGQVIGRAYLRQSAGEVRAMF